MLGVTKVNAQGLTLQEWLDAAGISAAEWKVVKHTQAWNAGEDPTEWRK